MQRAEELEERRRISVTSFGPETTATADEETTREDLRNYPIADLVAESDVSVRLGNAIAQAAAFNKLPLATVGDYLDAGAQASMVLMDQVRNFGRKSARELEELVVAECSGWNARNNRIEHVTASDARRRREELLSLVAGETLGEIAKQEILSARLTNILHLPEFAGILLTEALSNRERIAARLLRTQNCGRTSVKEFHTMCARYVSHRLREAGFAGQEFETALSVLLSGEHDRTGSSEQSQIANSAKAAPDLPPEYQTLAERIEWLLAELDERARDILRRRNGIGQNCPETLEEIGTDYGVVRERIRQIESKSLRRLNKRIQRVPILKLLDAAAPSQWSNLSRGKATLLIEDLHERRRSICPYVSLALDITNMTLSDWLDRTVCRFHLGWRESTDNSDAIKEAAVCLKSAIDNVPLPRAAGSFEQCGCSETVAAACELVLGCPIHLGYVMPARVGARLGRLVGLHSILGEVGHPTLVEALLLDYHSRFPDDLCSVRDAEIVMTAAPHLFLEVEEGRWHALGIKGDPPGAALSQATEVIPPDEDAGTIAHSLQMTLKERGPTRLGDLLDDADKILPEGRSINSIGPVLLTRRELFVRALPGVYALPEHVPDEGLMDAAHLGQLFNDNQARLYALARYAGEPREIFPFWTAKAEYELCRWARHSGSGETFGSLISISEIEAWPLPLHEREQWHEVKRKQGRFSIGTGLRHQGAYVRPDLERVLAASVYSQTIGSLNWMAANRLTGRKIDSHGGAGLVALLVQLGVLEEPEAGEYLWQMPHSVTSAAQAIIELLADELARSGELCWEDQVGKELRANVEASDDGRRWVDASAVSSMLSSFEENPPEDDGDPIASLLQEQKRVREADRREATLQWLLDD